MNISRRTLLVAVGFLVGFGLFFSPVLFGGRFLSTGEGLTLALPSYLRAPTTWEPGLMLGYPWAANFDGYWYPLSWLRSVPHSFNAFMLAAYVVAAVGTHGLVLTLTRSSLGALVAALAYALGGFMIAHVVHDDLVHPAAWMPWLIWALAAQRAGARPKWIVLGAVALGLCATSGGPQVLTYGLIVAVAYAVFAARQSSEPWSFVGGSALTFGLGLGLAAVVLVPAAELARESVRATIPFDVFDSYTNRPIELAIRLFFPFFLGRTSLEPYAFSAFDAGSWTEQSLYVGLTTLVFALLALLADRRRAEVLFWGLIAAAALVLTTGDAFGLARLVYHVPLLNLYRAQGRHAVEFTLAAAVLAGYGVAAVERGVPMRIALQAVVIVGAGLVGVAAWLASFGDPTAAAAAAAAGLGVLPTDPLHNPALGIPIVLFAAVAALVVAFARSPHLPALRCALLACVLVDLGSFAWFGDWRSAPIDPRALAPPALAATLRPQLERAGERVLPFISTPQAMALPADLTLLWGVPLASGRVQLELRRVAALLRMDQDGLVDPAIFSDARDRSLDLAAVRYVVLPAGARPFAPATMPWAAGDLDVRIGSPAWTTTAWVPGTTLRTSFARPIGATRVLVASSLSDGETIPQGASVAELRLVTDRGLLSFALRAGRDTAERGHERAEVRAHVRHGLAPVLSVVGPDRVYAASFGLPAGARVRAVELRWNAADPRHGYLNVDNVSLVDDRIGRAYPIAPATLLENDVRRWRPVASDADGVVLKRRQGPGRAWIVHRVIRANDVAALAAIRTGAFDPAREALVAGGGELRTRTGDEHVAIEALGATTMELAVDCATRCFVVTSDAFYPGWHAAVDGRSVPVVRADYALRGAMVDAGRHRLVFWYASSTQALGLGLAAFAALCALLQLRGWHGSVGKRRRA